MPDRIRLKISAAETTPEPFDAPCEKTANHVTPVRAVLQGLHREVWMIQ
jgi:hypothetical protein